MLCFTNAQKKIHKRNEIKERLVFYARRLEVNAVKERHGRSFLPRGWTSSSIAAAIVTCPCGLGRAGAQALPLTRLVFTPKASRWLFPQRPETQGEGRAL